MRNTVLISAAALTLAGCAASTSTSPATTAVPESWPLAVSLLQNAWPLAENVINKDVKPSPILTAEEAAITADINSLSPNMTPTAGNLVSDVGTLVAALPLTAQQEQELLIFQAAVNATVKYYNL